MLVLTRKQNEKICIGDDVTITVVRTKGNSVRLGIQAPAHVRVLRGEIATELTPNAQIDTKEPSNAAGARQSDDSRKAPEACGSSGDPWPTRRMGKSRPIELRATAEHRACRPLSRQFEDATTLRASELSSGRSALPDRF